MSIATLFQEVENAFRPMSCCSPRGVLFQEDGSHFILEAVVAGVKADQLEISVDKGAVSVEAKSDRYNYSYSAMLPLGDIDENSAPEASLEDGVLKIKFPKAKRASPLKITVKQQ